jgi:hypothetical protein
MYPLTNTMHIGATTLAIPPSSVTARCSKVSTNTHYITMSGGGSSDINKKCGLFELIVFIVAIVFGTACSILSKTMMGLHGKGITGEIEQFEKPIFQSKRATKQ